ncbi:hypothetical protein LCGC14_1722110 [marine sediment metagenome]|uniref:Uncharacterized protein n=1 Tax=marine sediment metagenome TaxID=412755 RepID=A0A0F9HZU0_9ZZZZ
MPITHLFVSPKADGADDSVVQPDDWNDDHIIGSIELPYAGLLTVAAGVIAVTGSFHSVAPESGGSDQVDTINGGIDGMVSLLRPDTDAQVIDLMHGTGNIEVQGEDDIRLDNTEHVAWLVYDGTLGKWLVSNPGTAAHIHASATTGGIMANPRLTGYLQIAEDVGAPAPAANTIRLVALDDGGVTKLYYRASDGTVYGPLVGYTDAEAITAVEGEDTLLLAGNVGVAKSFSLSGDISPAQLTANTNNWDPAGLADASRIRTFTDASRDLTGIVPKSPDDGRVLIVVNIGSNDLVLKDEGAGSSAANRFGISGDITLAGGDAVTLQYDTTSNRWRAIGSSPGGAGGGMPNAADIWIQVV